MRPQPDIELLLAEWALERLAPEEVPELAVRALQDGCESAAVAVLAGLQRPTRGEVEAELPSLLLELGETRPGEKQALKRLVDDCLQRIVAGARDPAAGAQAIRSIWEPRFDPERHPQLWIDLRPLVAVSEPAEDRQARANAAAIVAEARSLLQRGGLNTRSRIGEGQLDGRTLSACSVQEHVLGGLRTPLRLALTFQDGTFVSFGAARDGGSLELGNRPLREYDLGEHGGIEVRGEGYPCEVLKPGAIVRRVTALIDRSDAVVGVALESGAACVYAHRQGDNLAIAPELPEGMRSGLTRI